MQSCIDMAPAIATVRDYADDAIRSMRDIYSLCLDHSLGSLAHIDYVLTRWRDGGAKAAVVAASLYAFGSYAGEVLREQEPGRWVQPTARGDDVTDDRFLYVRLLDGREWRPIDMVFCALTERTPPSLLQSARELLAASPDRLPAASRSHQPIHTSP